MVKKYIIGIYLILFGILPGINLVFSASGSAFTYINIQTTSDTCIVTDLLGNEINNFPQLEVHKSYWYRVSGDYQDSRSQCYNNLGTDLLNRTNWDYGCCPVGYVCNRNNNICNITNTCDSLSQNNCDGAEGPAAAELQQQGITDCGNSIGVYGSCNNFSYCTCRWDSTLSACQPKKEFRIRKNNDAPYINLNEANRNCFGGGSSGSGGSTTQPIGTCTYDVDSSGRALCEQGADFYEVKWTAIWSGTSANRPADCPTTPQSITVSCEKVLMLNFFTLINIIGAILIIFIIYFLIHLKGKKKKRKNKAVFWEMKIITLT